MSRRAAKPLPSPAEGVCTPSLPEPLPDEPAVLKALLRAQQHAFAAREIAHRAALEAREAELQKAFEARILALYEHLRLARRRLFGPSSESHAGQGWLFDEAEALIESAPEVSDAPGCRPPLRPRVRRPPPRATRPPAASASPCRSSSPASR